MDQQSRTVDGSVGGRSIPVLPRTRVTFTSLTGAFEESIVATYGLVGGWENRSPDRDAERVADLRNFTQIQLCGAKIAGLWEIFISGPPFGLARAGPRKSGPEARYVPTPP